MLTRDTLPRASAAPRGLRVRCTCGADLAVVEPGFGLLRSGDAGAEQTRTASCSSCGRSLALPVSREGAR
jgi:hypothetical protein